MNSFKKGASVLSLLSIASLALGACGTMDPAHYTPPPAQNANEVGNGAYMVSHFEGVPAHDGEDAVPGDPWSPVQFRDLQYLDYSCHKQLDPYIPSAAKEIGSFALKEGIGAGLGGGVGTGLGAISAFSGVSFLSYLKYGGIASFGSGFGSGAVSAANQHRIAVSYVQYACMAGDVYRMQQKGHLKGVTIIPWAGTTWAIPTRNPDGPNLPDVAPHQASSNESADNGPPPPMMAAP